VKERLVFFQNRKIPALLVAMLHGPIVLTGAVDSSMTQYGLGHK
jgi:hypothetical protein